MRTIRFVAQTAVFGVGVILAVNFYGLIRDRPQSPVPPVAPSFAVETTMSSAQPTVAALRLSRTFAEGKIVAQTLRLAVCGNWLLAMQSDGHLIGVNLATGLSSDLTGSFSDAFTSALPYNDVWAGRDHEFFMGSTAEPFLGVLLSRRTPQFEVRETRKLKRSGNLRHSLPLSEGHWLSNGFLDGGSLLSVDELVNTQLVTRRKVGYSLFPDVTEPLVALILNKNTIATAPDGNRLVQAFLYTSRIQIYTASGTPVGLVTGPVEVPVKYGKIGNVQNGGVKMRHLADTTFCYTDITGTSKGFVALFSGKTISERAQIRGDRLHAFKWDGSFLRSWRVEPTLQAIAASGDGKFLWAFRPEPTPALVEYLLPINWDKADQ